MKIVEEVFWQTVVLATVGLVTSFLFWKVNGRKKDFGSYLNKYGDLLAYLTLLFIVLIIIFL